MTAATARRGTQQGVTLICFLGAILEGVDIQSMGVAAPKLAPALHLAPPQMGLALSASTVGLMIGAAVGGRLADRYGYRIVLVASLLALGVFSLMTTTVTSLESLIAARVLTGIGIGGVFPCLIALVVQVSAPARRATALSIMYAGLPFGGAIAGGTAALLGTSPDWRSIFYLGGIGPLLLAPAAWYVLRRTLIDRGTMREASQPITSVLFGGRTTATLLLWVSFFFTMLVVYLLLNWLPSLLVAKGFSKPAALAASMVYNVGSVIGSIALGMQMDRGRIAGPLALSYVGIGLSLAALAVFSGPLLFGAAFTAGLFASGSQLVLYALAPLYYPAADRGTGIGIAIGTGRLGSVAGPIMAGLMIGALGANGVLAAAIPGLALALITALVLLRQPQAAAVGGVR